MTTCKEEETKTSNSQQIKNDDDSTEIENNIFDLRTKYGKFVFIIVSVLISILIQFLPNDYGYGIISNQFQYMRQYIFKNSKNATSTTLCISQQQQPTYAIYGLSKSESHLVHVENVLKRMNYKRVSIEDNWNLLWAHDYPFRALSDQLHNLNKFQKVNHIPGAGHITNKVDLSTTDLPFIPRAFKLPGDKELFIEYSNKNPNKLFVQKHNQHRHIHIKPIQNIEFNSNDSFVQEFVENPYLVDGYKFDIGVYVIVTSIDPLRVYIYTGDVLFRFCPVKYYPFDTNNIDKYIVGDDYLPIWNVPSLRKYYQELQFGMKDSFDAYVKSQNQDPKLIWDQVEYAIRTIILEKEKYILGIYNRFKRKENFFELMRFDLIIDENLKVYLMEANMSPNLSSAHFKPNKLLYEQILYNLMNLVGIGSKIPYLKQERSPEASTMISDYKNIVTFPQICSSLSCNNSCKADECKLCNQCLTNANLKVLQTAFEEHIHRANTKRIFPVPITNLDKFNFEKETANLTSRNKLMSWWFYGKCKLDVTWCI